MNKKQNYKLNIDSKDE